MKKAVFALLIFASLSVAADDSEQNSYVILQYDAVNCSPLAKGCIPRAVRTLVVSDSTLDYVEREHETNDGKKDDDWHGKFVSKDEIVTFDETNKTRYTMKRDMPGRFPVLRGTDPKQSCLAAEGYPVPNRYTAKEIKMLGRKVFEIKIPMPPDKEFFVWRVPEMDCLQIGYKMTTVDPKGKIRAYEVSWPMRVSRVKGFWNMADHPAKEVSPSEFHHRQFVTRLVVAGMTRREAEAAYQDLNKKGEFRSWEDQTRKWKAQQQNQQ